MESPSRRGKEAKYEPISDDKIKMSRLVIH